MCHPSDTWCHHSFSCLESKVEPFWLHWSFSPWTAKINPMSLAQLIHNSPIWASVHLSEIEDTHTNIARWLFSEPPYSMSILLDWGGTPNEQALPSQMITALHTGVVGSTRIATGIMESSCSWPGKWHVGETRERKWFKVNNPVIGGPLFWPEDSHHEPGWGQMATCRSRPRGVFCGKALPAWSKVSKVALADSSGAKAIKSSRRPEAPWGPGKRQGLWGAGFAKCEPCHVLGSCE